MTRTTETTQTVIDRYITLFDRTAHDPAAVEEYRSIFATDATVQLAEEMEPVTGLPAIMEVYRGMAAAMADSKHLWDTTVLDDGRIECHWVNITRSADGRLLAMSGIEYATVNADGLMTNLTNRMVTPESMT
ncbi:nuclear transport factor 2 family protein [Nonomuraea guangzhouensis]|uniref:Nuclear transport factor 2 family protein n=1 Tax=Nonomuraea guangzhouensis TaxID=1291555 RepID=A0ABW4GL97_9ACTN|nr:nuclear transport factor 2 family protein [Nonomuraea guangzhouensis]